MSAAAPEPAGRARRWRWAEFNYPLAWSAALATLTLLPYLAGASWARPDEQYLGFVFNPDEPNVHLSWIRQASEGVVLFRNEFTSEPHEGRFFNLFMLLTGRAARAGGLTAYQAWAVARLVAIVLFGLACYAALIDLLATARLRRYTLALITLSSGLGWYAAGRGWPVDTVDLEPDLVMPEAITFLHLYLNPLFTVSVALLIVVAACGYRALRRDDWPAAVGGGLAGLLLANIHTYDAVPLTAVLTAYLGLCAWRERHWSWPRFARYAVILGLMLPAVAYQAWLIRSDPLYAAKANTPTLTPPWWAMGLSYGLLIPLALAGAAAGISRGRRAVDFWSVWLLVHGACLYLPAGLFPFQRKMAEGLHVPLAALAALGLLELGRGLGGWLATARLNQTDGDQPLLWGVRRDLAMRRRAWLSPTLLVGLFVLMPSNILFVQSTLDALQTNNAAKRQAWMPPFRIPQSDYQALLWLRDEVDDGVVLCLPPIGSYLPGIAGQTVYLGHWAETIRFAGPEGKLQSAARFFRAAGTAVEKTTFLRDNGITHVYYGSYERLYTDGLLPRLPALREVYPAAGGEQSGPVRIFRVLRPEELSPGGEPTGD